MRSHITITMPLSSDVDRGNFNAPERKKIMDKILVFVDAAEAVKDQAKPRGAWRYFQQEAEEIEEVSCFADVVKKVMAEKGKEVFKTVDEITSNICDVVGLTEKGLKKLLNRKKTPKRETVVFIALGLGLKGAKFYEFLAQANYGLNCDTDFDRVIRHVVGRSYDPVEVSEYATASINDPFWHEECQRLEMAGYDLAA